MLPFQFRWLPITLGLMMCSFVWLFTLGFATKFKLIRKNQGVALLLAYSIWLVVGAIYSGPASEAEKYLVLKVPFAAWPILLGSVSFLNQRHQQRIVNVFIYAVLAAIVLSFGHAALSYFRTGDASLFYFSKLVFFQMVPPHYFGMYINFAFGVVLYRLLEGKPLGQNRWLSIFCLLCFFLTLVFLSVRIQYLIFIVMNGLIVLLHGNTISLKARLAWIGGIILSLSVLAYALPGSRQRLMDTVNEIVSFEGMVNDKQTNHRKFLWQEGWRVVENNFWLGTGTGAANRALNAELRDVEAKFWDGDSVYYLRDKNYNFHNSYLQHWATHGLIGLLIFLGLLIFPFVKKGTPVEGKILLGVCALSFLTESMLQRQAGVLFFSFFYCVFFVIRPLAKKKQAGLPDKSM